jgi:hypothetical protein
MRKHTSGEAIYHFLPGPPNVMSCGVPEISIRKGGQWQTRKYERQHNSEVAVKKTLMKWLKALTTKGNSESDPPFWEAVQRFKITHVCKKTQTTQGIGMGGARAVISQPEAMAMITRTVNPCGLAHPCRSLDSILYIT